MKAMFRILAAVICLFLMASAVSAQEKPKAPESSAARPDDVKSMDSILAALYDVISGPAGKKRDWVRMRSLFVPGAQLIPVVPRKDEPGKFGTVVMSVEDYVKNADPYFDKEAFYEREIARRTENFDHIAQVWSTYESRHDPKDPKPFERGINGIEMMNDNQRWWIVGIFWEGESEGVKIPEKYVLQNQGVLLPPPIYPPLPRQARITGKVEVRYQRDDFGNVTKTEVESGPPMLRDSAESNLAQWRFGPGAPLGAVTYEYSFDKDTGKSMVSLQFTNFKLQTVYPPLVVEPQMSN